MTSSTVLQLIQRAKSELGLMDLPSSIVGTQSSDDLQLLALLNAVGSELCRQFPWNRLLKTHSFLTIYLCYDVTVTTGSRDLELAVENYVEPVIIPYPEYPNLPTEGWIVKGDGIKQETVITSDGGLIKTISQPVDVGEGITKKVRLYFMLPVYNMPPDYDRIISRTQWDKSKHWEMIGPLSHQEWAFLKSGFISTSPRIRWRINNNKVEIWPPIAGNTTLGFEYFSDNFIVTGGVGDSANSTVIVQDGDKFIFPDRLLILGLKMKYFDIKGFNSSVFTNDYQAELERAMAMDGGNKTLSSEYRYLSTYLITPPLP